VPDLLYLPPVEGEFLQGDIFDNMPSAFVESRPLRVARPWEKKGGHDMWEVHQEDGPGPRGGFKWRMDQGGEPALLVHAHVGLAMIISHDCEIENDPNARTLAMIRQLDELDDVAQRALFSGREEDTRYALFPLEAQDTEPQMDRAFVDFRRLTTVRPDVLRSSTRIASASEELRGAVAQSFRLYLFRRLDRRTDR
jgi:hypothetical protein